MNEDKKIELVEDFKTEVLREVENSEAIPSEVNKKLERIFKDLMIIYENYNAGSQAIEEYIYGSIQEVKGIINNRIGNKRKNSEFEHVNFCIERLKRLVEEKKERIEYCVQVKEELSDMKLDDNYNGESIMGYIEDGLLDAKNYANRILYSRGYSDAKIEQINEMVTEYIRRVGVKYDMSESLDENRKDLVRNILTMYYKLNMDLENAGKTKEQLEQEALRRKALKDAFLDDDDINIGDSKKDFRESLNAGISLEDQANFQTNKPKDDGEKENDDEEMELPSDAII